MYIFTAPGLASCRRRPLSSNVMRRFSPEPQLTIFRSRASVFVRRLRPTAGAVISVVRWFSFRAYWSLKRLGTRPQGHNLGFEHQGAKCSRWPSCSASCVHRASCSPGLGRLRLARCPHAASRATHNPSFKPSPNSVARQPSSAGPAAHFALAVRRATLSGPA